MYIQFVKKKKLKKNILIIEKAPSHICRIKYLDKKEKVMFWMRNQIFLLSDIDINRQSKDHLKNKYLTNLADNIVETTDDGLEKENVDIKGNNNAFGDIKKTSQLDEQRLNILNQVIDVRWDDEKIKTSTIINSFNKAEISYPLDSSKDADFVFPEKIIIQKV